jgi:hypothetical protein
MAQHRLFSFCVWVCNIQGLSREIAPGSYAVGATADPRDPVYMIKNKDGSLEVEDMQGNRAKVLRADLDAGKSVVHVIDRVLLNGKMPIDLAIVEAFLLMPCLHVPCWIAQAHMLI